MNRRMLNRLIGEAKQLRTGAIAEAKRRCAVTRSCGVDLDLIDERGELIHREYGVSLTQSGLIYEVERAMKMGEPACFALSGTVDGADSVWGLNNWDYDPQVETWGGTTFTAAQLGVA